MKTREMLMAGAATVAVGAEISQKAEAASQKSPEEVAVVVQAEKNPQDVYEQKMKEVQKKVQDSQFERALKDLVSLDSPEHTHRAATGPGHERALDRKVAQMIVYRLVTEMAGKKEMTVQGDQYYDAVKKLNGYYLKKFAETRGNKDGKLDGRELEFAEKDMLSHTGLAFLREELLNAQMNQAQAEAYENARVQDQQPGEPVYQAGSGSKNEHN